MNISVYIPSYNQLNYLREAIESVLSQTLPASQIIVVDDASSDDSPDLISDYTRQYPDLFTPIYHKYNTGIAQVRIDALKEVRGDYVTYVDGDDWFLPEKLDMESAALRKDPSAKIAFSNNEYMTEDKAQRIYRWVDCEHVPQGDVFFQTVGRLFPKCSLFRMELVDYQEWCAIGFHDNTLSLYEDFDMRIRLTHRLKVIYVDQVLSCIRTQKEGLSKSPPEQHFFALDYVFNKNCNLYNSLPNAMRNKALSSLANWIAPIGYRAAKKAMLKGNIMKGLKIGLLAMRYNNWSK